MKFLFFDIECSNCFRGRPKMCEFGYVLTDEHFKVLRKDAIPMSPGYRNRENGFDLGIYKREPGFQWAYSFDDYFSSPQFPEYYGLIKKLLTDEETLVFGYAVDNDIHYLGYAMDRYRLERFEYEAYDIQTMMRFYSEKRERFIGLKDAFKKLCSVEELMKLQEHLSRDDAFMSMRVFQRICENLEVTPLEMIEVCNTCKFNSEFCLSHVSERKRRGGIHPDKKNQTLWGDFCREKEALLEQESSIGRIVTVSAKIKEDGEALRKTIDLIKEKSAVPFDRMTGSDYLVALDEEDANRIKAVMKYTYAGRVVTLEEFERTVFD